MASPPPCSVYSLLTHPHPCLTSSASCRRNRSNVTSARGTYRSIDDPGSLRMRTRNEGRSNGVISMCLKVPSKILGSERGQHKLTDQRISSHLTFAFPSPPPDKDTLYGRGACTHLDSFAISTKEPRSPSQERRSWAEIVPNV